MRIFVRFFLFSLLLTSIFAVAADQPKSLELSRAVRPWEFMCSVGQRAAVFGHEDGDFETWVYPVKLLRNFHLNFFIAGRQIPGSSIARTIVVRPESTTIVYVYDQFEVRETITVPVEELGVIVRLETNTYVPVQIEAAFTNDMQLMWPAGLGNIWPGFDEKLNAFTISGEPYYGIIGANGLIRVRDAYITDYGSSDVSAFRLPEVHKGNTTQVIAIAGSLKGHDDAEAEYKKLLASAEQLEQQSAKYYRDYLARTLSVGFPSDPKLQDAYDWARVSMIQGLVANPYMGAGLIAGYRTSDYNARPGFAWFFGRDSEWTDMALNSIGDFATTRTALEFIAQFQREDGRIPHEIAQTATLTDWWKTYPYGVASADATPLFIITVDDYVTQSGDTAFATANWEHISKAYDFLKSTYDEAGFARNAGVGHGWVEGGPLVPIHSELYESGLAVQAERSLAHLAQLTGKTDIVSQMQSASLDRLKKVEEKFWIPAKNAYAFGIGMNGQMDETTSVLATVPMWFGLLDAEHSSEMIDQLASSQHAADWGMRILSEESPLYNPEGYHFGAVWPLFTGWASVAEYRYHRPLAAYQNLRANAMLTLSGALGHTTEVLSGAYMQQHSISSPHQIWSAAMVVSPVLRGMMGLTNDAGSKVLTFAPHIPAGWQSFSLNHVAVSGGYIDITYSRSSSIDVQLTPTSGASGTVRFSPALSPWQRVLSVTVNGRSLAYKNETSTSDKHVTLQVPVNQKSHISIALDNDFELGVPAELPALGSPSVNIKPVSQKWTGRQVEYVFEGIAGQTYYLPVRNPLVPVSIQGAHLTDDRALAISFPAGRGYVKQTVLVKFK